MERCLLDGPALTQSLLSHGKMEGYIFLYGEAEVPGDLGQLKDEQNGFHQSPSESLIQPNL